MGANVFQLLTFSDEDLLLAYGRNGQAHYGTVCNFVPETRTSSVNVPYDTNYYFRLIYEIGHILGLGRYR